MRRRVFESRPGWARFPAECRRRSRVSFKRMLGGSARAHLPDHTPPACSTASADTCPSLTAFARVGSLLPRAADCAAQRTSLSCAAGAAQCLRVQTCLCVFPLRLSAAKPRRLQPMLGGSPPQYPLVYYPKSRHHRSPNFSKLDSPHPH